MSVYVYVCVSLGMHSMVQWEEPMQGHVCASFPKVREVTGWSHIDMNQLVTHPRGRKLYLVGMFTKIFHEIMLLQVCAEVSTLLLDLQMHHTHTQTRINTNKQRHMYPYTNTLTYIYTYTCICT